MIKLNYTDETGRLITFSVFDWDAVAEGLVNAPIDLEYLNYEDGRDVGVFNLNTFERC